MDTHYQRKAAAKRALGKAHDDGITYEEIGNALDIPAHSLRSFRRTGNLGPAKTIQLLEWLAARGYPVRTTNNTQGKTATMETMSTELRIARDLENIRDVLISDAYSPDYKARHLASWIVRAHEGLPEDVRAIQAGKKRTID